MDTLYFCIRKAEFFLWYDPDFAPYPKDDPIFIFSDRRDYKRDSETVDRANELFWNFGYMEIYNNMFRIPRQKLEEALDILAQNGFELIYSNELL